jgi:hypothetical protein
MLIVLTFLLTGQEKGEKKINIELYLIEMKEAEL